MNRFRFELEEVVQAKPLQQRKIPLIRTNHAQEAAFQISEAERNRSQSAHECRIHEFTFFKIENKRAAPFGDHSLNKFFNALRILKSASALEFHPNCAILTADKYRGYFVHKKRLKLKAEEWDVKPLLPPHVGLAECDNPPLHDQYGPPGRNSAIFQKIVSRDFESRAV